MQDSQLRLAIVVGSTREGRFGHIVANWFARHARNHAGFDVDVIDIATMHFPVDMSRNADVEDFSARIDAADAIVVLSPEYNHSYSGPLKTAIDSLKEEWKAKPVGFVAYGGMSGGLRAVEALRVVFAELHAVTVRDTVSFHIARTQFDEQGEPVAPEMVGVAADTMLNQLVWWASALNTARAAHPYGERMLVTR
ncbi:MAG TPA: NAD(P)H-dependent oxidoreductase [Thermomicrobiales bacterium]|nr:NAD(P)H-dependent oxidoreductase [Thermomicrobiales bacterium]